MKRFISNSAYTRDDGRLKNAATVFSLRHTCLYYESEGGHTPVQDATQCFFGLFFYLKISCLLLITGGRELAGHGCDFGHASDGDITESLTRSLGCPVIFYFIYPPVNGLI